MPVFEFIKLLLPLILICLLLFGVLIFVKRYSFKRDGSNQFNIKVLSSQMIMPKKFISVVRVNDKMLVLGVSENSITMLKEFEAAEEFPIEDNKTKLPGSFAEILKKNLGIR